MRDDGEVNFENDGHCLECGKPIQRWFIPALCDTCLLTGDMYEQLEKIYIKDVFNEEEKDTPMTPEIKKEVKKVVSERLEKSGRKVTEEQLEEWLNNNLTWGAIKDMKKGYSLFNGQSYYDVRGGKTKVADVMMELTDTQEWAEAKKQDLREN